MHYYQRWAEHDRARARAAAQADAAAGARLDALADATATPASQLKFVADAWHQVVQCRRVLKWTYAYGYYRFAERDGVEKEGGEGDAVSAAARSAADARLAAQQEFFEFAQGQAEAYLEQLHAAVEKKLDDLLDDGEGSDDESDGGGTPRAPPPPPPAAAADLRADAQADATTSAPSRPPGAPRPPPPGWPKFREALIGLTDVTRTHFDRLVAELERGLDNLATEYAGGDAGAGGAGGSQRRAVARPPSRGPPLSAPRRTGPAPDRPLWTCAQCTFANDDMDAVACGVCERPRDGSGGESG
jgi:ariadne-1